MKKSDRELGMYRPITRRDFIHDTSLAAAGLSLPFVIAADAESDPQAVNYPPTLTGLRGSHPGSFETAHALARRGKIFPAPNPTTDEYDLIVVGAGISGLAAAHYYKKRYGDASRILLLENHDDFGGHARRNEFHQGGSMRLALGGTHNLEHWQFSETVNAYMAELGVDYQDLLDNKQFAYGTNGRSGPATWFDEESYGKNLLVTGCHLRRGGTAGWIANIDRFPISETARGQLRKFFDRRENVLAGMTETEMETYARTTPYYDFLREHGGLGDEALQLFDNINHGNWGIETRSLSVAECVWEGMPGLNLLGKDVIAEEWDYPVAMYPDGNASIARLQLHSLIPAVAPGANADNIALAVFDYGQLDQPGEPVRLRLNATAVNVSNKDQGVTVDYVHENDIQQVKARHCVMACYHNVIPHLCPQLTEAQKAAQKYQVKMPLLLTNVLLRSSEAMDKLGINGAHCPGRMHADVFLFRGINTGGYHHKFEDDGPVPLTFWGSISPPADVANVRDQFRASRAIMLNLTFEDYEREVRTVLDGMLSPAGFDVQDDILAITVNRWPHGYAYEYLDLWDPAWPPGQAPHEIARKPMGNITIANADAGASAYTHVAIDEAYRAVQELPS